MKDPERLQECVERFEETAHRWRRDERPTNAVTVECIETAEELADLVEEQLSLERRRKPGVLAEALEDLAPLFRYAVLVPWRRVYARLALRVLAEASGFLAGVALARWIGVL